MPTCGCAAPKLYLTGFQLSDDLARVEVQFRCASCDAPARARYLEGEPLEER